MKKFSLVKKSVLSLAFVLSFASHAQSVPRHNPDFNQQFDNMIAKQLITKRINSTNARDFNVWESLHTKNACRTAPAFKGEICGVENMSHALKELIVSFPDYKLELLEVYRSKKNMFAKIRSTGTFLNPMDIGGGVIIQPTGKSFSQEWVANINLTPSGKIERFEEYYDQQDLLIQLGLAQ